MPRKSKSEYAIQTVSNALRVLEAFNEDHEIGVAELSRRLGLHKNNVFRLLATLEQDGYIEQSAANDRYRLGVAAAELGHSFTRSRRLLERSRPMLESLVEETGETAHLAVMDRFEVVHLDGAAPHRILVTSPRVGRRLPIHCTALGKTLLGCSSERLWQAYDRSVVSNGGLEARTERTIVDPDKFFAHLHMVASRGYSIDVEELEAGVICVAAPVFDAEGEVVAAFSVSAPRSRFGEEGALRELCPSVTAAAESLSADLGHHA
jgi:IclR family transcriptional regulator, KDG regulon repressor